MLPPPMPTAKGSEELILGAILVEAAAREKEIMSQIFNEVEPDDFYHIPNRNAFTVARQIYMRSDLPDPILINQLLKSRDEITPSISEMTGWMDMVISPVLALQHIKVIKEQKLRRETIVIADEMRQVDSGNVTAEEILEKGQLRIARLKPENKSTATIKQIARDYIKEMATQTGPKIGLTTGVDQLDDFAYGLFPGELIIVAGATSMGKTAFAIRCLLANAINLGKSVVYFAVESGRQVIFPRIVAQNASIHLYSLIMGQIQNEDMKNFERSIDTLSRCNIMINDTESLSTTKLRSCLMRYIIEKNIQLVIVDHLLEMREEQRYNSEYSLRTHQVVEIKSIARKLNVPIMLLTQLHRGMDNRKDRRPRLSDLRDSGRIEEEADKVILIYRPGYYSKDETDLSAELILAKNRNGPLGTVQVNFDPRTVRFY
jgi:replicative DNA helicase